jgi:hypothetical protein
VLYSRLGCWPLPANIRLGWKGFPGTNTLAYYEYVLITPVKTFLTFDHELKVIKFSDA